MALAPGARRGQSDGGRRSDAGITLVEAVIGALILVVVSAVAISALISGNKVLSQGMSRTAVDENAQRLMNRIVEDLRQTGPSANTDILNDDDDSDLTLLPGTTATDISFRPTLRWDSVTQRTGWKGFVRYRFTIAGAPVYTVAETQNGQDDNGNGLVDEGFVERFDEATNRWEVIAADVLSLSIPNPDGSWAVASPLGPIVILVGGTRSPGFYFSRGVAPFDDQLEVTVTTAGRLEDGQIYFRQITEIVLLRN
ncbi:MAG: hypothetical protein L0206_18135 [Actinobacteria bacterium]|nr:hypothetical protein [Actinomycetota bacterium]